MQIRHYITSDKDEVIQMVKQTIYSVNKKDYNYKQILAWTAINESSWDHSVANHQAIVMIDNSNKIIGFADMDDNGYLENLFVHKNYQNMSIGTKLVTNLETHTQCKEFSTFASITAKPFFEKLGYDVVRKNIALLRGQYFKNYYMKKANNIKFNQI
ncbi:GNAT family N-acetyltransferase [Tetragenococcus osmophilus]|uniref:Acetyltransferase n=1 Tax=Tetragenococcus osmophilus TaxID=526944 RepID=A0AA38CW58_9ENTE|nr:GNAT family N-acetyltransferase [Tetragenococcus osmophilus]AYW48599.1 GNAT family N-acetyltransferase [Tetragenococcus osmophilus]GMA54516.1 acetyltransferase [Alicyclobacillus contaminans]GMA71636.1 acetyltransferase [Tetragenococcus osmophilus]